MNTRPFVSAILTTRDRPHFLPIALACFEHQRYPNRELIVVDDGEAFPVDESLASAPNVKVLRVKPGLPIGVKLNLGADAASGDLCMKMDDDDWYGPEYLETSVSQLEASRELTCQPTIVFHAGFLFFELGTWRLHESTDNNAPGATLIFAREDWQRKPFRPLPTDEDVWFYRDQIKSGAVPLPVVSKDTYVAIRHHGHQGTFGHTWTHQLDGATIESYLESRPLYKTPPEELFPEWALKVYRRIHEELQGPGGGASSEREA